MKLYSIKLIIKHITKNKLFTFVTVAGFSISLMFIILLSTYIRQEVSVDQFHKNKDRIYRLYRPEGECWWAYKVGADLLNMFPEIESFTAMYEQKDILSWNDTQIQLNYLLVDSSFFNIFSFKLVEGARSDVLRTTHSIVLSEKFAREVFKGKSPIGQEVSFANQKYIVSGIMAEFPDNTHFKKCDAIINFQSLAKQWNYPELLTTYDNNSFSLYFLAKKNADLPSKAPQVLEFLKKEHWLYKVGRSKSVAFEPLKDIYFSNVGMTGTKRNSPLVIKVLSAITVLILILSIINYTNLTIAQSVTRTKEMAVRRVLGSSKKRLIWYSASESISLCFIAALVAIFLSILAEPVFNRVLETNIHLSENIISTSLPILLVLVIIVGTISGVIPAIAITGFNPASVTKGSLRRINQISYSKLMVAFQYSVVIGLLICTIMIFKQTYYMQNKELGFNKENIIWFKNYIDNEHREAFVNEVRKIAGIQNIAYTRFSPLDGGNNNSFTYKGRPESFQVFYFDSTFIKMMDIKIQSNGSAYSKDGVYMNETGIKELELDKNSTSFEFYNTPLPILGVVKDFNFNPLYQPVKPALVFQLRPDNYASNIFIKISSNNTSETFQKIKNLYKKFTNGKPLEINFVEATIDNWYKKEANTARIIGYFAFLAIIISGMGILALSIFYSQERTKEIGIRKVNGANNREMIALLIQDFVKWIALAFVLGCPIAYYVMSKWLQNFAYKTELSWWIFAVSGTIALVIALLTVSIQSYNAATRNPVESLKYE